MLKLRHAVLIIATVVSVVAAPVALPSPALAGVADLLPDLEMAPIFDLQLRTSDAGRKHLRFGTTVRNVGDGPMEVRARERQGSAMQRVYQWIATGDGSGRRVLKPDADVFYAGDGHVHWHVARFNRVTLTPVSDPTGAEKRVRKIGFCLVDTVRVLESAAFERAYMSCGSRASTSVKMGISVGWADVYAPETRYQAIDVTGLPAGSYRLCATTNPRSIWTEKDANATNNSSWLVINLDPANGVVEPIGEPQNTPC